jgi:hypothetical protein
MRATVAASRNCGATIIEAFALAPAPGVSDADPFGPAACATIIRY